MSRTSLWRSFLDEEEKISLSRPLRVFFNFCFLLVLSHLCGHFNHIHLLFLFSLQVGLWFLLHCLISSFSFSYIKSFTHAFIFFSKTIISPFPSPPDPFSSCTCNHFLSSYSAPVSDCLFVYFFPLLSFWFLSLVSTCGSTFLLFVLPARWRLLTTKKAKERYQKGERRRFSAGLR